jgi:hypothetical protein
MRLGYSEAEVETVKEVVVELTSRRMDGASQRWQTGRLFLALADAYDS